MMKFKASKLLDTGGVLSFDLSLLISDDSLVWVLEQFVDQLDLSSITCTYSPLGQHGFCPKMLLRVIFYGYSEGIRSGRALAQRCKRDLHYIYLSDGLQPSKTVFNDFRNKHHSHFEALFKQQVSFLQTLECLDLSEGHTDGTTIRANASSKRVKTKAEWRVGKELELDFNKIKRERKQEGEEQNALLIKSDRKKQKVADFKIFSDKKYTWPEITVESACIFIIDCLHSTPKFEPIGKFVIDTTCISPFKIHFDKARKVNDIFFKKWVTRLAPANGDLLFSREGTIGVAVRVPNHVDICIGQRMMLFRFSSFVTPAFGEIYFNSLIFKNEYFPHIKGVAAQHLNIGDIRKFLFPVPPLQEQAEIVRRVEALFAKADRIEANYQKLKQKIEQLPQAILAKAFKGELVAQLPSDGDARDLLEAIQKLKAEATPKKSKRKKK